MSIYIHPIILKVKLSNRMGNQVLVVFLSLIAFGFAITSNANTYTVGDNSGWDISTNLDTWEQDKKFIVGDVLGNYSFILYMCFSCYLFLLILRRYSFVLSVFQYASTDSVCEVGKESFQTCNTTNVIKCFSDGNTSIPLTSPGERYFFCGNRLYCYSGMKLDVLVERNQSIVAEAPLTGVPEAESGGSKNNNPSTVVPSTAMFVRVGSESVCLGIFGLLGILIWIF